MTADPTSPTSPVLRHGTVTADLVPLLTAGRSVLLAVETTCNFCAGELLTFEGPGPLGECMVNGMSWARSRFAYLGELDPPGDPSSFILAPEGGWTGNPVPGAKVCYKTAAPGLLFEDASEKVVWSSVTAFRLAQPAAQQSEAKSEIAWLRVADAMVDDIMSLTDAEVLEETARDLAAHLNPALFSDAVMTAHVAASPYSTSAAREAAVSEAAKAVKFLAGRGLAQQSSSPSPLPVDGLLPCPHCASHDVEWRDVTDHLWKAAFEVACNNCGARTGVTISKSEAITAWNTRQSAADALEAAKAENERLKFDVWSIQAIAQSNHARATRAEAEAADLRKALEPFARLEVPKRSVGNAGAYSILHSHIRGAQEALAAHAKQEEGA